MKEAEEKQLKRGRGQGYTQSMTGIRDGPHEVSHSHTLLLLSFFSLPAQLPPSPPPSAPSSR